MNRFLKVFALLTITVYFTSCKKNDDDINIPPPRDYAQQYVTEKAQIEDYLKNNYIVSVSPEFDVQFAEIEEGNPNGRVSIWDQTQYPLLHKDVTYFNVTYRVYYISFREGVNERPTRGDEVTVAYRGTRLDNVEFDNSPFPQTPAFLSETIEGWQKIIPLFKSGILVNSNPANPADYADYGAGVMFLPSALGYYNNARPLIPAYTPLIFSFKLYSQKWLDTDNDGLLNKDEMGAYDDIADNDTDGDGRPDYLDTDDDGDGVYTADEIGYNGTTPVDFNTILDCNGGTTGLKKHLDPACH